MSTQQDVISRLLAQMEAQSIASQTAQNEIIRMMGVVQGELTGIRDLIQMNHEHLTRRVDDVERTLGARITTLDHRVDDLFDKYNNLPKRGGDHSPAPTLTTIGGVGAGGGALGATLIELLKPLLGS